MRNGYYLTEDRGSLDEDGYIWFVGRSDDVILSAGSASARSRWRMPS